MQRLSESYPQVGFDTPDARVEERDARVSIRKDRYSANVP